MYCKFLNLNWDSKRNTFVADVVTDDEADILDVCDELSKYYAD